MFKIYLHISNQTIMKFTVTLSILFVFFLTTLKAQPGSGKMLDFNGSSNYVDCGSINLSSNQITLQGWIRVHSFKSASPYITSLFGIEQTGSHAAVRLGDGNLAPEKVQFILLFGSTHIKLNGNTTLSNNTWYHIAATYDGATMKIYINGVLDASVAQTGTFTASSTFEIGRNYASSRIIDGELDDISVFNTALSQTTIRNWMCKKITSTHPNYSSLTAYWPLNEGSGSTTEDVSNNSYNGTLTSGPTWKNSGAPIGDRSKYVYGNTFSFGMSHSQGDSLQITHNSGTTIGAHIYRVDSVPYNTNAPSPLLYFDTNHYWGVFIMGTSNYTVDYYYDGNALINNNDCNIGFAKRNNGAANNWDIQAISSVNYSSEIVGWDASNTKEFILAISANGPHTIGYDMTEPTCFGDDDGSITLHVTGGLPPYDFVWANGSIDSVSNGLATGYHVFTITDDNGCISIDSIFLDEPSAVSMTSTVVNASCKLTNNGSINATAIGGSGSGYSFLWNDPNNSTTAAVTNLLPGTYMATITDGLGCEGQATATVGSIGPDPIPDLGPDTNVCGSTVFGMTAQVTNGPATSFAWSTGETGAIKVVSSGGTFILTVTNSAGCMGIDTIVVTYVTPVQVNLGNNITATGNHTINAGPGFTFYQWSTGATGQTLNVNTSGQYAVTVTDSNGCHSADTVKVTIIPAGISSTPTTDFWTVSPNPAKDFILIKASSSTQRDATIELFDITGRIILSQNARSASGLNMDISQLIAGKYFIRIVDSKTTATLPFYKMD